MFDLAVRYRAGIDIHLHDGGELGFFELGQIAERCRAHGLAGRVAVSHAYALGMVAKSDAAAIADQLARAGVAIMTSAAGFGATPAGEIAVGLRRVGLRRLRQCPRRLVPLRQWRHA